MGSRSISPNKEGSTAKEGGSSMSSQTYLSRYPFTSPWPSNPRWIEGGADSERQCNIRRAQTEAPTKVTDWDYRYGRKFKVPRPHRHATLQPAIQQVLQEYKLYQWTDSLQHPKSLPKQVHALTV